MGRSSQTLTRTPIFAALSSVIRRVWHAWSRHPSRLDTEIFGRLVELRASSNRDLRYDEDRPFASLLTARFEAADREAAVDRAGYLLRQNLRTLSTGGDGVTIVVGLLTLEHVYGKVYELRLGVTVERCHDEPADNLASQLADCLEADDGPYLPE